MQVRNKRQGSRINAILHIKRININAILHIKRINILPVFCDETFYSNRSANDTTNVLFYKSMVDASIEPCTADGRPKQTEAWIAHASASKGYYHNLLV